MISKLIDALLERLFKSNTLLLLLIGIIVFLLGAGGGIKVGTFSFSIDRDIWRVCVASIGILLLAAGLRILWVLTRKDLESTKPKDLDEKPLEEINCDCELRDLFLYDGADTPVSMPPNRMWRYEMRDAVVRKYAHSLSLDCRAYVWYPDSKDNEEDVFILKGNGSFDGKTAFLEYGFYYPAGVTEAPRWRGAMVLRIPTTNEGPIRGVWLTTQINQDKNFPIGTIELTKKKR